MSSRYSLVLILVILLAMGCARVIKPSDKPLYDKAVAAIEAAKIELKNSEKAPEIKDLTELFNTAKMQLSGAEALLDKNDFSGACESAVKARETARTVRELPGQVQTLIAEVERNIQFAKELGMDKTYGKKIKEVESDVWDVKEKVRFKKYEPARVLAVLAQAKIKKALDDVEKATNEITKAKTALAEAKDANADTLASELYRSAEEALETAKKTMDNANFTQAVESASKAAQLARDALVKAKEAAAKKQDMPAPLPEKAPEDVPKKAPDTK